jgi:hypothetical protein
VALHRLNRFGADERRCGNTRAPKTRGHLSVARRFSVILNFQTRVTRAWWWSVGTSKCRVGEGGSSGLVTSRASRDCIPTRVGSTSMRPICSLHTRGHITPQANMSAAAVLTCHRAVRWLIGASSGGRPRMSKRRLLCATTTWAAMGCTEPLAQAINALRGARTRAVVATQKTNAGTLPIGVILKAHRRY